MGGDAAPAVEVAGAVAAARQWQLAVILVGQQEAVAAELKRHKTAGLDISIEHADDVVTMHDAPRDAVRRKPRSSIRVCFDLVAQKRAQAVVSAGNSGATMAAGMFLLKRIQGIERPAIATIMPNLTDRTVILDVGANVDCKPRNLQQFAVMGDVYARQVLGQQRPRVGLLSNGEEEKKGTELTRQAHLLLKDDLRLNYLGYIEGRDVYNGQADVVVCDGFVGNVVLKVSEGLAESVSQLLRREIKAHPLAQLGYLLARPAFKAFRRRVDYAEYGGAPLLGIQGTGIICHGGSNDKALKNAIGQAALAVQGGFETHLAEQMQVLVNGQDGKGDEPSFPAYECAEGEA